MKEVAHVDDYPTVDDIAHGMGEMLGRLHWHAGYDGHDIEFIMGGASFSGIAMNVIDFNQVSCDNSAAACVQLTAPFP